MNNLNIIQNYPSSYSNQSISSFEGNLMSSNQSYSSLSKQEEFQKNYMDSLQNQIQQNLTNQKRAGFKIIETQFLNKQPITLLEVQNLLPKKQLKIEEKLQKSFSNFNQSCSTTNSNDQQLFQIKQEDGQNSTELNSFNHSFNNNSQKIQPLELPQMSLKNQAEQKQKLNNYLQNPLVKQILNYDFLQNNNNYNIINQQQNHEQLQQLFVENFLSKNNEQEQFQLDNVLVIHKEKKASNSNSPKIDENNNNKKSKLSKFHSKKKEFLNDILSFYTHENLEKIYMPASLKNEIIRVTKSLKEICQIACGKKVIEFNRVHYFLLFLTLNEQNIEALSSDLTNKNLHSLIFNFDMCQQDKNNQQWKDKCQYINFIKDCIYQIAFRHIKPLMDQQFQLKMINELQQQKQEQGDLNFNINQELLQIQYNKKDNYEERAFEGVKSLNQGTIVLRF